jgi:hypothetical protein
VGRLIVPCSLLALVVVTVASGAFCGLCGDAFADGGGLCSVLGCLAISSSPVGWNMPVGGNAGSSALDGRTCMYSCSRMYGVYLGS